MTRKGVLLCLSRDNILMSTQHTGDEEEEIQGAENAQERGHNPEQSADDLNSVESEQDEPEPAEIHEEEMERSLPAPTLFNADASDLYSEWKHWVSAFDIYLIASGLSRKEDPRPESNTAALPWPGSIARL